ncbi:cation diffusion facilitator family transporter [Tistrella sp.]|uniref:cation diffusion facilitator family transporter n=1 Tax=Tistrella sp. TaxID=2024861 RepID=UPI0025EA19B4|nr:cation diffusion facilitator family transporter [Tistrella sp.]
MAVPVIRPLGVLAPPDPEVARLKRRVTLASLAVALTLVALKLAASVMTGSVSILSSLVDSVSDSGASLVTLIAVRQAMRPADAHHRFGHGKAEPLAALGQALFVTGSALLLCVEAVRRLITPEPVGEGPVGIAVMIFAIVATLLLVRYQDRVIARTQSLAVGADRLHYVGDLLINLGVILSILLSQYGGVTEADPVIAALIALHLIRGAWKIARGALDALMDRELPEAERAEIRKIVLAVPGVRGMHDLRTRSSSVHTFIQLHLELDAAAPLADAHGVADRVETLLHARYPDAEVITHLDPKGVAEFVPTFR